MKKLLTIILLLTTTTVFSQHIYKNNVNTNKKVVKKTSTNESKIKWYTDMNESINLSLKTGKPLLLFFTGSDWCGWCKKLQREVFFKDEFIKWANSKVILVELDFPRKSKLPENIQKQNRELAQNFGVRGYPSIYFVQPKKNSKGIELSAIGKSGYVAGGPNAWIKAASQYIK